MEEINSIYFDDLQEIKQKIQNARTQTMVMANSTMIVSYYQIGEIINKRKSWGTKYVQKLADDLKNYGVGYSFDQLMRMSQFAATFTKNEILEHPVPKIPWGTIIKIIQKSSSKEEMLWFVDRTYSNKWSRKKVLEHFESDAFRRGIVEPITTEVDFDREIIKDSLDLHFINKNDVMTENDLKTKLIDNVILFLQELGPGFSLVGKEYRLITKSGKSYFIDLLMYHTKIHAYVVIEVKLDTVEPGDFGQLNFYINAINEYEKTEGDKDTIGILLCKSADNFEVQTTLKGITNPIGVSKYKVLEELPIYLEKRLKEIE